MATPKDETGEGDELTGLIEAARARPADPEAHRRLASAYHRLGDFQQAESQYRKAIELDPTRPSLHNNLANVLADDGRLRDAIDAYTQAIDLSVDGGAPEAELNRELARLELTLVAERVEFLEKAAELGVEDAMSSCALACGYILAGRMAEALDRLRRAVELDPADLGAAAAMGIFCALPFDAPGDPDEEDLTDALALEGLTILQKAVLQHPREARLHMHMGELQEMLGRSDEARASLLRAIEIDPACLEACDLASRYAKLGPDVAGPFEELLMTRIDEAGKVFDEDRSDPARVLELGIAQLAFVRFRGEEGPRAFNAARNALTRAVQIGPDLHAAHRHLAWLLERIGSPRLALNHFQKARELAPQTAEVIVDYGRALLRAGRIDDAFEQLQQACTQAPCDAVAALALRYAFHAVRRLRMAEFRFATETSSGETADALVDLARAQLDALQLAAAAETCEKALEIQPDRIDALLLAGRAAHRLGDLPGAENLLRRAVNVAPDSAEPHQRLGQLLAAQPGRMDEAMAEFNAAHRLR